MTITTQRPVDEAAAKPAPYALGGNLYLNVEPSGSRQWQFVWKVKGRKGSRASPERRDRWGG